MQALQQATMGCQRWLIKQLRYDVHRTWRAEVLFSRRSYCGVLCDQTKQAVCNGLTVVAGPLQKWG
jgi:hypothetical protein